MKVLEIAFVGYPVTDLKRAIQFYEEALQLKRSRLFGDETTGWLEYDIGPGTVAISNMSPDWKPSPNGGSAGLEVDDFQAAVARLREQKVPFRAEPFETPVCWIAVVSDPDGNSILIHKRKT